MRILEILKKHWEYLTLFILSTIFFIYQHIVDHRLWDFYVYTMNGRYWFHKGFYFELYRAPIAPLILGLLGGNLFAEFGFIILVSSLFAVVTYYLAKQLKINELVLYGLMLSTYTLLEGLASGTELLSLVFLEIGILLVLKDDIKSGIGFALSFLTRYTMASQAILVFFHRDWKKVLISIGIIIVVISPWLIYNKLVFGNYFASIADSYALNIYFRSDWHQQPKFNDFLVVGNVIWIPFLIGLRKFKLNRENLLFVVSGILVAINYFMTPLKIARYLFPLILPIAYFASKATPKKIILPMFIAMLIVAFAAQPITKPFYMDQVNKIKELNLSNCYIESNIWALFDYGGLPTSPSVRYNLIQKEVNKGSIIILDYQYSNAKPIMYKGNRYIIYGYKNNCTKQKTPIVMVYLDNLNYNLQLEGKNETYTYCDVFLPKICNLINKI